MISFDWLITIFHHCCNFNLTRILTKNLMLYIPKIDGYLKILIDEEVKDFVAINVSEYFKSIREEQNLRKVAKSPYIFSNFKLNSSDNCIHIYNVETSNIFRPELQLINTKPVIKNKLKELLSELENFKVQTVFVLHYMKKNDPKIFHSRAKLVASDSDIDETFIFMHESIMTKNEKICLQRLDCLGCNYKAQY